MEEIKKCLICGGENFIHLFQVKDHFLSLEIFSISQCKKCGFKFTDPRPTPTEAGKYYESQNYISHSDKPETLFDKVYFKIRKINLKKKYNLICRYKSGNSILDIGCGTGEFLNMFKLNNWKVSGIESNKNAREIARNKNGIEVRDDKSYNQLEDKQFDVISMWHVLEHVYDTDFQLKQIKRLLKEDGLVVIAVPNSDSTDAQIYKQYWAAYDVPRHIYHFTQKSVNDLVSKFDFELIETLPMKFDAYYISMLSEKYMNGEKNNMTAFLNGMKSNRHAKKENNYSSLIYLFKNKK